MIDCAFLSRLSSDCETKVSKAGRTYLKLSFRIGEGDAAEWVNVLSFDEKALSHSDKFTKGALVFVEGRVSINRWKAQDGSDRAGLSVMSFHTRVAEIGNNRPRRDKSETSVAGGYVSPRSAPAGRLPAFDDEIPFAPEVR